MPTNRSPVVALLITELAVGGAEKCLVQLALGLAQRGFSPQVISLGPRPAPPQDALVKQLESAGIQPHFLGGSSIWKLPSVSLQLLRLLKQLQPDILQTFLFHANVLGSVVGSWVGIATIVAGIRVADPRRWRMSIERRCATRQNAIVCVSQSVETFCRDVARFPPEKLTVIPNGIDTARYENITPADLTSLNIAPHHRLLLCLGRLDTQKGLDWLLPLLPDLFKQLPEHRLLLVGEGPQRAQLQQQIQQLHLQDQVILAGWRGDVPQILARSEMLLLSSRWEGMPNVVLEAMAAAKPVVVTRAEGTTEILGPLAAGQLIDAGDASAFVAAIEQWAGSADKAKVQGKANFARVKQHFSLEAMIDQYAVLYAQL